MSDQYIPPRTTILGQGDDSYGRPHRPDMPVPIVPSDGGGALGTGFMVAAVFVVVALIAAAVFNKPDTYVPTVNSPAATVSNGAAADMVAPDPSAPAAIVPVPAADPAVQTNP